MAGWEPTITLFSTEPPPTITGLPFEIKTLITSFLNIPDLKSLVLTCRSWQAATERRLWESIELDPCLPYQTRTSPFRQQESDRASIKRISMGSSEDGKTLWDDFHSALARRPSRLAYLKRFNCVAGTQYWPEMSPVIPLISPTIENLRFSPLYYDLTDLPNRASDFVDVARYLPCLRRLEIILNGETVVSDLMSARRSTPFLEELWVDVDFDDGYYKGRPPLEVFPNQPRLSKLHIASRQNLMVLLSCLASKAKSLRCLHISEPEDYDDGGDVLEVKAIRSLRNLEELIIDGLEFARSVIGMMRRRLDTLPRLQRFIAGPTVSG
jgi:hypothetical protein